MSQAILQRTLTAVTLALVAIMGSLSVQAQAKATEVQPTPKTAAEFYAERAMRDAARMLQADGTKDVIGEDGRLDIRRAQIWLNEARTTYAELCRDRTLPKDQWARNCKALGDIYRRGQGIPQSYRLAKAHYRTACLVGDHIGACVQQAYTDHTGRSGRVNYVDARLLYDHACSLGDAQGCAGLGNMLYRSQGGEGDRIRGMRLLQESCKQEYAWACERLRAFGLPETVDRF
ncbi:MAG: hypothetical protein AAGF20_05280 [Pseudomonadota bacterium]